MKGCYLLYSLITLFSDILLEPTNVVLNSFPTWPMIVAPPADAGDCVGLGRYTIDPAFGLLLNWCNEVRRCGVTALRSYY